MKREISSWQREIQDTGVLGRVCRLVSDNFGWERGQLVHRSLGGGEPCPRALRSNHSTTKGQPFHLVSACFTWFQLSGEKNWNGQAENLRFQLRGTDAQAGLCRLPMSLPRTFHLRERSAGISTLSFHLVSPGCTYDTLKHDKTRYFLKNLFAGRPMTPSHETSNIQCP